MTPPRSALLALLLTSISSAQGSPGAGQPIDSLPATLPPGLTLPVVLTRTLRAGKTPPGTPISAHTTQRIPLAPNLFLPRDTAITGAVLASTPTSLTLQFTTLTYRGQSTPVAPAILAAATFIAVSTTALPATGSTDRANPDPANWTTAQLGGDQIARSGWFGPVINSVSVTVGSADPWGVYTLPAFSGALSHALGPFSANSSGLFGFPTDCQLHPASPATLACAASHATLHHGDVLLLRLP